MKTDNHTHSSHDTINTGIRNTDKLHHDSADTDMKNTVDHSKLIVNTLPLTEEERRQFSEAAPDIRQEFVGDARNRNGMLWNAHIPQELRESATAVIGNAPVDEVSQCPNVRWLQTWSAGFERYAKPGILDHAAVITNASGAYGQSVSEHLFAMMWALMKRLPDYGRHQAMHRWEDAGPALSPQNANAVIIGTGDIGSSFALLAKSVGMRTYGVRRDANKPAAGIDDMHDFDDLDNLLSIADVVAMAVPSTAQTHHILDTHRLSLLKATAIVLNAGRGDAIDTQALTTVLHTGSIWGAGIDVSEPEPLPADDPLWDEPRCLLTPHVAGGNHLPRTMDTIIAIALENVGHYALGEALRNRRR